MAQREEEERARKATLMSKLAAGLDAEHASLLRRKASIEAKKELDERRRAQQESQRAKAAHAVKAKREAEDKAKLEAEIAKRTEIRRAEVRIYTHTHEGEREREICREKKRTQIVSYFFFNYCVLTLSFVGAKGGGAARSHRLGQVADWRRRRHQRRRRGARPPGVHAAGNRSAHERATRATRAPKRSSMYVFFFH